MANLDEVIRQLRQQPADAPISITGRGEQFAVGGEAPPKPTSEQISPADKQKKLLGFVNQEISKLSAPYEQAQKQIEGIRQRAVQHQIPEDRVQRILQKYGYDKIKPPKIPENLIKARMDLMSKMAGGKEEKKVGSAKEEILWKIMEVGYDKLPSTYKEAYGQINKAERNNLNTAINMLKDSFEFKRADKTKRQQMVKDAISFVEGISGSKTETLPYVESPGTLTEQQTKGTEKPLSDLSYEELLQTLDNIK